MDFEVTSELGELDDPVREQVTQHLEQVAVKQGHDPSEEAEHRIEVSITWAGTGTTDFAVEFRAGPTEDIEEAGSFVCSECNAAELLRRTGAQTETILETLFPALPAAPPPAARSTTDLATSRPRLGEKAPLGRMGWMGIGSLAIGVSGAVVVGVLVARGTQRLDSDVTQLRDFRPAGYASLAVGGVALVVGSVLLAIDRSQTKESTSAHVDPGSGFRLRF